MSSYERPRVTPFTEHKNSKPPTSKPKPDAYVAAKQEHSAAPHSFGPIKDELGAVQMIKVMTKEQKLLLNDMVQSVLIHQ